MTPTIVHRYAFPTREAIEALLGDAVGDCEAWRIRVEGDEVIIDVVAPAAGIAPTIDEVTSLEGGFGNGEKQPVDAGKASNSKGSGYDSETSNEAAKSNTQDSEPELKGGPLARRAAIACGERGFWTFLGVSTADDAKADVCRRCWITTRKMLDHDDRAAAIWEDIDGKYRLWLEGHDVELD
jgi:hypothetical protein